MNYETEFTSSKFVTLLVNILIPVKGKGMEIYSPVGKEGAGDVRRTFSSCTLVYNDDIRLSLDFIENF